MKILASPIYYSAILDERDTVLNGSMRVKEKPWGRPRFYSVLSNKIIVPFLSNIDWEYSHTLIKKTRPFCLFQRTSTFGEFFLTPHIK